MGLVLVSLLSGGVVNGATHEIELNASKDTFGRSNKRTRNSGAADFILVASVSTMRSLVAFDLSKVTNTIVAAEFSFRVYETASASLSFVVAPMIPQAINQQWVEGMGNLGVVGQNARQGEATYQWQGFRDQPWLTAEGTAAKNLMDPKLWKSPETAQQKVEWTEGEWISIKITDLALLETLRASDGKSVTYGIWGTAGRGLYKINSKESGKAPRLTLTVEDADA